MHIRFNYDRVAETRFERCGGCGRDGKFYQGDELIHQVLDFAEAVATYDAMAPHLPKEVRKAIRQAVCSADFLAGYDSAARSPLWATPGERRPFLEEDYTY